jgi:outer membrane lipoprotein carrier protein
MDLRLLALFVLTTLWPGITPALADKSAPLVAVPDVPEVVGRVQKLYEGTSDLHARFTQSIEGVMGKRLAGGEVWLKKPGKMRWDYDRPDKKLFIADGTQLWVYEPEDEQAFRQALSSSQLPAQVSFLFGKGRLLSDFDISLLEASGLGTPGDIVLKLVPKAATAQYRYLAFVVDPKAYLVKETVVYDQQGGLNHLSFSHIEMNLKGGIDDARFRFTPPPGTKVITAGK